MEQLARFPYRFFVVTFVWSWLVWLPLVLATAGILPVDKSLVSVLSMPVSILAAFGPAVGAFVCLKTLHGEGAVRQYLRGLLDFRLGWQAWFIPILVLGGSTWLAWILPELWGEPRVEMFLPSVWVFLPYVLFMILFLGGQEELGWRGYILDTLEARLGAWLGNLLLGVIWAFWHLPLFFIQGTSQTFMPFAGFVLLMTGYSWFFSWVRQVSGKRTWAGLIVHGWANAFVPLFPTVVMVEGAPQPRYWIWVGLTFVIGLITMVIRSRKTNPEDRRRSMEKSVVSPETAAIDLPPTT
ncbi:type II CAAX endopeptidase family protein [Kocuria aegyptia]|uniref:Type II CAAX endopeptidase family protein n=1 Tax=Kocuria aegyptia TaxID=330943 RepID=A0ABN2KB23_9MICC